MRYRVGVDIGGTFTDAVAVGDGGPTRAAKALSTPGRLHEGVLAAVRSLEIPAGEIGWFVHGTTAGLNAVLERRGAQVALMTTEGFRDVYAIGRASRPAMYDLHYRTPTPLVSEEDVYELPERMDADGNPLVVPDPAELAAMLTSLGGRYEALAVVFLHSYANPDHELAVLAAAAECAPGLQIVLSHQVAPEWREFERTSTTVMSAYIAPVIAGYLNRLELALADEGVVCGLRVMESNGGVMSAGMAGRRPLQTLFSGPVGGTVAGVAVARELAASRLVCADMGGTSFDVSLVVDGEPEVTTTTNLDGFPLLMPSVAIHTIGAGGGSVGFLAGGGLRVGPRSAGADPGPACYGRGGTEPTVTDANLVLGRLPRTALLGGDVGLDVDKARNAVGTLAEGLGLPVDEVASGMISVADAAMANAIREITVDRGIDPREFDLVAFGGAAALHAVALAEDLDMPRVIVPFVPGVLSARGMVDADTRHDLAAALFRNVDELDPAELRSLLDRLRAEGRDLLVEDGIEPEHWFLQPAIDLRYVGQEYSLSVPFSDHDQLPQLISELPKRFADAYLARYGHNNPGERVECINVRITALGTTPVTTASTLINRPEPEQLEFERTWFAGEWHPTPVFSRRSLGPNTEIIGPAIVLESSCTTLLPPGWIGRPSDTGHLVLTRI